MEGLGARLGRSSARYGPATTFTGPVRKWRKEWVPITSATATVTSAAASSTGTGSRGNNLVLFKWTPLNCANGRDGEDEEMAGPAEMATRRRRYVPVSVVEDQRQESAKSDDDENKANDGEPSSTETEQSNGKNNIDDTLMGESQVSDEVRDSDNNVGGTDLNLNLGLKDPNGDDEGDTSEQHEIQTEHRLKRKSPTPDLEMRIDLENITFDGRFHTRHKQTKPQIV